MGIRYIGVNGTRPGWSSDQHCTVGSRSVTLCEHTAWHALFDCLPSAILFQSRRRLCACAYSERRCQLRDQSGRQTLPPVITETQKLEGRRRDSNGQVLLYWVWSKTSMLPTSYSSEDSGLDLLQSCPPIVHHCLHGYTSNHAPSSIKTTAHGSQILKDHSCLPLSTEEYDVPLEFYLKILSNYRISSSL